MTRRQFDKIFKEFEAEHETQIWVITRVKKLPKEIVQMAMNLANLDFINYVRICDETLAASNENYPKRPKVPITDENHETATGVKLLYHTKYKTIDFFEINSRIKGNRTKMVDALLKDFPENWNPCVSFDWSNGFWDKMKNRHKNLEWLM